MVTDYFKNLVADVVWHTSAEAALPDTYYLTASVTEPLEDGTGVTEPSAASGFARIAMGNLGAAVDGVTKNTSSLIWPKVAVDAEAVAYWALFDAEAGGNLLMGGALDGTKHLDAGTSLALDTGALELHVLGA